MKKTLLIVLFITGFCFGQTYELAEEFYYNGFPKVIKTYKVSKGKIEIVKKVSWYDNGQKEYEGTFKDGEKDGLYNVWYDNGQKRSERIWKDGDVTTFNEWDEDGSLLYSKKFIL